MNSISYERLRRLLYQKVNTNMAEIEAISGRHFQSPNVRGQIFFPFLKKCPAS